VGTRTGVGAPRRGADGRDDDGSRDPTGRRKLLVAGGAALAGLAGTSRPAAAQTAFGTAAYEDVGVPSGVAATDADGDVVRPLDGAKILPYQVGDLLLATAAYGAGPAAGGAVNPTGYAEGGITRRSSGHHVLWDYVQTRAPADPAIGTAYRVVWDAELGDNVGTWGPIAQSGYFGPRGVWNLEGWVRYAASQATILSLAPITFADMLKLGNKPGVPITLRPGWQFLAARIHIADGETVTLGGNDFANGGAAFAETTVFLTANDGEFDGDDSGHFGRVDGPMFLGNTHVGFYRAQMFKEPNRWGGGQAGGAGGTAQDAVGYLATNADLAIDGVDQLVGAVARWESIVID